MKRKIVKSVSLISTILFIILLSNVFTLKNMPDKIYTSKDLESVSTFKNEISLNKIEYDGNNINVMFMGLFPLKCVEVQKIDDLEIYPGGECVGVRLESDGSLVVGFSDIIKDNKRLGSPAKDNGIHIGDLITRVNGKSVATSKEVLKIIEKSRSDKATLTIRRDNKILEKEVKLVKENNNYKMGLWIRDSAAGIGTMTFYEGKTKRFGALGHPITDSDTHKLFSVKDGDLYNASIISLKKGEVGNPGELKGIFLDEKKPLGNIEKNTDCGIFGEGVKESSKRKKNTKKPIKIGFRNEVKEGNAKIISTIDEDGPKEYDVEIVKKVDQEEPSTKSMVIKVVDPELLKKTGGIVQGMSGSPIIQNGKIVGAVTHVLVNKPDVGYGIYIDWMLKDAGLID